MRGEVGTFPDVETLSLNLNCEMPRLDTYTITDLRQTTFGYMITKVIIEHVSRAARTTNEIFQELLSIIQERSSRLDYIEFGISETQAPVRELLSPVGTKIRTVSLRPLIGWSGISDRSE